MTVDLTYNPFTGEKTFLVDGRKDTFEECWGADNKELAEWCKDFFKKLYEKYNDSQITVNFKGILRDYEFLEDAVNDFKNDEPKVKVTLVDNGCADVGERLGELKRLFEKMQEETPFSQLKAPSVKEIFEKAVSSDFEMAVVATMSSGKSTLINAMLGSELLPARNEATTAVLAKIHDIDGADHFEGRSFDKAGNELVSCNPLTLNNMNELNDNPNTSSIEIYGDIKGIASKDLRLILTDTPGPNNSRTDEHKSHTYALLKAEYKPMILYVLNGTQLETNDDNTLLNDVAEAMKAGGRQAQERFIFVLNKADAFDPDKGESIPKKIQDVNAYLEKHGIRNARIFPAAALLAKVIRQHQNRQMLTETEEDVILPQYKGFIKRENKHFSKYAPLSSFARKKLDQMLSTAREQNNNYQEALIHTGILAIEVAISEYLSKYALPAKITEGVRAFGEKLDNLGIEAAENEKLKNNKEEVEKRVKILDGIAKVLENGEKSKEIQQKIDGLSLKNSLKEKIEDISCQFMSQIGRMIQGLRKSTVTKNEFEDSIKVIQSFLKEYEPKFKIDIQGLLSDSFEEQVKNTVEEYNKYLSSLLGEVDDSVIKPAEILGDMASISVDYTIDEYVKAESMKKRQIKGAVASAVTGGGIAGGSVAIAAALGAPLGPIGMGIGALAGLVAGAVVGTNLPQKILVDANEYVEKEFIPGIHSFVSGSAKIVFEQAEKQENDFKEFFKGKFSELENAIRQKIEEQSMCLKDKEKFEKLMQENERNIKWIQEFQSELNALLAI